MQILLLFTCVAWPDRGLEHTIYSNRAEPANHYTTHSFQILNKMLLVSRGKEYTRTYLITSWILLDVIAVCQYI